MASHGGDPQSLTNPSVLATAPSAAGGVWLAGSRHVLEYLDTVTGQLQTHLANIDARPPDSMLESRRGLVWIAVEGTLIRYDPQTRQARRWQLREDVEPDPDGAADRPGWMAEDAQGRLWVTVLEYGLQIRNQEGQLLRTIVHGSHGLEPLTILDIRLGPDGQIWLSNNAGLRRWDPAADRFVPVDGTPSLPTYLFRLGEGGVVWTGLAGEIRRYLWDGKRLKHLDTVGKSRSFRWWRPMAWWSTPGAWPGCPASAA